MKWFLGAGSALTVCLTAYMGSAVVSLANLVSAVRDGDAVQVMALTDVPRVRHSIVDQIVTSYLEKLGRNRPVKPLERLAVATFGATVADDLANRLITADNLAVLLKTGAVRNAADNTDFGSVPALASFDVWNAFDALSRVQPIKPVEFALRLGEDNSAGSINMHFEGIGLEAFGDQPARAGSFPAR